MSKVWSSKKNVVIVNHHHLLNASLASKWIALTYLVYTLFSHTEAQCQCDQMAKLFFSFGQLGTTLKICPIAFFLLTRYYINSINGLKDFNFSPNLVTLDLWARHQAFEICELDTLCLVEGSNCGSAGRMVAFDNRGMRIAIQMSYGTSIRSSYFALDISKLIA